jgi:hypothetical protein
MMFPLECLVKPLRVLVNTNLYYIPWGPGLVGVLLLLLGIIPGIAQSHLIHLLLHFVVIVKLLGQLVLVVAESATTIETHVVGTTGWATLTTRCQVV